MVHECRNASAFGNVHRQADGFYGRCGKRLFDFVFSALGLFALALPMGIIAVLIKLTDSESVLFTQKRVGRNGQIFDMYKFRTMKSTAPRECPTHLLACPERYITKIGRILRKTSLDELPQLFNILKGQMSFVGPRPALWNQDDLIAYRARLGANDVRPGLTGWAQINGRDRLDVAQKAELDGEYVRKMGLLFDCKCLWRTVFGGLWHADVIEGKPQ